MVQIAAIVLLALASALLGTLLLWTRAEAKRSGVRHRGELDAANAAALQDRQHHQALLDALPIGFVQFANKHTIRASNRMGLALLNRVGTPPAAAVFAAEIEGTSYAIARCGSGIVTFHSKPDLAPFKARVQRLVDDAVILERQRHERGAATLQAQRDQHHADILEQLARGRAEVSQSASLVNDAIGKLMPTFVELERLVRRQQTLAAGFVGDQSDATGSVGLERFLKETAAAFALLAGRSSEAFEASTEMLDTIRDVETNIDAVVRVFDEVEGIADQTNLLALNATI
ncbi:MAG TPA: hypothetical protein VK760_05880, partial [Candidatus Acidoferrales bacterium]|nr:hypothetical protein [Candidatus Acidoferrales bacterium]